MSEDRPWAFYIRDMLDACARVVEFTEGMDQTAFLADVRTYHATLHNLQLIGEAATHLPETVRDSHPAIPWRNVIGARHRIIHGYLGLDDSLIWIMVSRSVPDLIPQLHALIPEADKQDET